MSKKYVCDICNSVIDNPYKMKMREFYVGFDFTGNRVVTANIKTFKSKIDICGCCFDTLQNVAMQRFGGQPTKKEENEI